MVSPPGRSTRPSSLLELLAQAQRHGEVYRLAVGCRAAGTPRCRGGCESVELGDFHGYGDQLVWAVAVGGLVDRLAQGLAWLRRQVVAAGPQADDQPQLLQVGHGWRTWSRGGVPATPCTARGARIPPARRGARAPRSGCRSCGTTPRRSCVRRTAGSRSCSRARRTSPRSAAASSRATGAGRPRQRPTCRPMPRSTTARAAACWRPLPGR